MVLKSSLLACLLAGVSITQAVPLGSASRIIDKRHPTPPQATEAAPVGPSNPQDLVFGCIISAKLVNDSKDKDDQLPYKKLLEKCNKMVEEIITAATDPAAGVVGSLPVDPTGPPLGPKGQEGTGTAPSSADTKQDGAQQGTNLGKVSGGDVETGADAAKGGAAGGAAKGGAAADAAERAADAAERGAAADAAERGAAADAAKGGAAADAAKGGSGKVQAVV